MENADQIVAFVRQVALWSVPVLAAVILHEVAHGVVALRLGDDTALRMGRLTLNPLPHIDPIGTVILPALLLFVGAPVFGYARPVPVNYAKLRDPRRPPEPFRPAAGVRDRTPRAGEGLLGLEC